MAQHKVQRDLWELILYSSSLLASTLHALSKQLRNMCFRKLYAALSPECSSAVLLFSDTVSMEKRTKWYSAIAEAEI